MGNVLVYGEHAHGKLPKATAVAVSAAKEVAAKLGGGDVILGLFGSDISGVTAEASKLGVAKVATLDQCAAVAGATRNDAGTGTRCPAEGIDALLEACQRMRRDFIECHLRPTREQAEPDRPAAGVPLDNTLA